MRAEGKAIGQSLLQRIGVREREKLQVAFLKQLAQTPLFDHLILRGGISLHGVWLHGRCSKDLDFLATPEIAGNFLEVAASHGFEFEREQERQMFGRMYTLSLQGQVFSNITIGLDLCPREAAILVWETQEFVALSGERIPVRVLPLAEQVGEKLRACVRRKRELDFYDIWLAFSRYPQLLREIVLLLERGETGLAFHTGDAMELFGECRETWFSMLAPHMVCVPDYETVRQDLEAWLPQLPEIGERWPLALIKEQN